MVVENCEELGDEVQGGPLLKVPWGEHAGLPEQAGRGKPKGLGRLELV